MLIDRVRELRASRDYAALDALIPYTAVLGLACRPGPEGLITTLQSRPSNMGNTLIRAVHGGVVGALLEHAAFMQLIWETDLEQIPKIVNLSIDYLRPVPCENETCARGTVVKQGRRVANVRIEAWQEEPGRPLAAAHAHFIIG
jgi:uncharacterized protein (TIGR00369 family)